MANTIKLKRSAVAGRIPTISDLDIGEVAINTYMGKMYIKQRQGVDDTIVEVGGAILTFGTTPPTNPIPKHGDRWLNSDTGVIAEYLDDGNTKQWVELSNDGIQGFTGSRGFVGSQGETGYAGSQGLTGYSGSLGYTGSVGANGANGYTGSAGTFSTIAPLVSKSATYTALISDYTILCTANSFTVNLPTAAGISGKVFNIKNTGSGTITVDGYSSETIDGESTQTVSQWENLSIQSNGSNWIIL